MTCDKTADNCTSCNVSSAYPYLNTTAGTCMGKCPTFYYPNLGNSPILCILCESPCNDCTNKTKCLSCVAPYYFYNGTCRSNCPSGVTIPNNTTR